MCLISDSDNNPIDPSLNKDQAPGGWDALLVQPQQAAVLAPLSWSGRQSDMLKVIQAVGGTTHDIDKAMQVT